MELVFALYVYIGTAVKPPTIYFYDINRCRYFARRMMGQPREPGEVKKKITALCKMEKVKKGTNIYY